MGAPGSESGSHNSSDTLAANQVIFSGDVETLLEGVYEAAISRIEDVTGQYGPQLKFTF